ncbi:MAG: VCBS repeat-containing protein [Bacteroidales bacterium]|nr:VCBS repeat-containing protein [Bacteroidales bacterium]
MKKRTLPLFLAMICIILQTSLFAQKATQPPGAGTPADPYQVSDLDHLAWMILNSVAWDKHYVQTATIDAGPAATWYSGAGFKPIGNYTVAFSGTYDGQNHIISNLIINRPYETGIGLFGRTVSPAVIKNLLLQGTSISASSMAGGLAGSCSGTMVENCSSSGNVSGGGNQIGGLTGEIKNSSVVENCHTEGTVAGNSHIGGLIGWVRGDCEVKTSYSACSVTGVLNTGGLAGYCSYNTTIGQCYFSGSVSGSDMVGGLAGYTFADVYITNCYNYGDATGDNMIGGICGRCDSPTTINACYSVGNISGNIRVGGLCGLNYTGSIISNSYSHANVLVFTVMSSQMTGGFIGANLGEVKYCFSTGSVTYQNQANPTNKGFIGYSSSNLYTSNFFDTNTSGQLTGTGATPKTTAEMNIFSTFILTGWDFKGLGPSEIWNIGNERNNGYPYFDWQFPSDPSLVEQPLGAGSEADPYQIQTFANLLWIPLSMGSWDKHFMQTADINATINDVLESGWIPVGNSTTPFTGSYNGQGNSINGLWIISNDNNVGFFGNISGAVIKKVALTDVDITGGLSVGSVAGHADNSSITECACSGTIYGSDLTGGIAGDISNNSTISNCYSRNDVHRLSGETGVDFGAFCGAISSSLIEYSYTAGSVFYIDSTNPSDKGFVGSEVTPAYTSNFWDADISNQLTALGATANTTPEMKDYQTFTAAGWDFKSVGPLGIWNIGNLRNDGYPYLSCQYPSDPGFFDPPAGSGTAEDPFRIIDLPDLKWITENKSAWDKHFIQLADIDASETAGWNGGAGFSKIGYGEWISLAFYGTYDGMYHTINGLTINQPDSNYVGMFGCLRGSARVSNLRLINTHITGYDYSGSLIGGVMLTSQDTAVINCFSGGNVTAHMGAGVLAGFAGNAYIINCHSSGSVTTTGGSTGGLTGILYNSAAAQQCYSSADVTDSGSNSGGLVGRTDANCMIRNCFSAGQVNGYELVGGLTGKSNSGSVIMNCYSAGYVSGTSGVGGFLGSLSGGTVTGCFWDTETSGQATSAAGTGLPTAAMKTESTFTNAGWDFAHEYPNGTNDYWVIEGTANNGYPILGSWMLANISTEEVTNIATTSANCGGNVEAEGLFSTVSARGVVWGTAENPTLQACEGFTSDGTGTGTFSSVLTGLSDGTLYYVRAYATNNTGTSYGEQKSFTTLFTPPGNALYFNGSNEYVAANSVCQALNNAAALTLECWINTTFGMDPNPYFLAFNGIMGTNSIQLGTSSDHKLKLYTGSTTLYGNTVILPGVWYHVALTIEANNDAVAYLNGNDEIITNIVARPPFIGKFSIGQEWDNDNPSSFYQGMVDEVRIWNLARTQQQLQENQNNIIDTIPPELVAYFKFDELSGSVLPDVTGNGNNGTLVNMGNENWVESGWSYGAPYLTTEMVYNIVPESAWCGGNVISEGNSPVTARGIVWGISENPELTNCLGQNSTGSGPGPYTNYIYGLSPFNTYHVRAYAHNSTDTSYGINRTFTTAMIPPGKALDFDGVNDYVSCGTGPVITGAQPRTIEAWAYTRAFNIGGIFQAGATGANNGDFSLRTTNVDESWRINLWGSEDIDVNLPGSKNSWHHYCIAYDGMNLKFYYDGNLVAESDPSLNTLTDNFRIGIWQTYEFNGMIDEVRVWNTARTQQEIQENVYKVITNPPAELIAYYRFDRLEGNALPDYTANGNDGTLYNMDNSDWVDAGWPFGVPFVSTSPLTDFSYHFMTGGGNVVSNGSYTVSAKGVVWDISGLPVLGSCLGSTHDGGNVGSFTSNITGLSEGTGYYVRAYAINSIDTSYGLTRFYATGIRAPSNTLDFDGNNDYVTIENEEAFDFTNAMTLEAWIRVGSLTKTWQAIITKGDNAWRLQRYNNTNFLDFGTDGLTNEDLQGTINVNDGKWHHVAVVYDGSAKYLYVDGRLDNMAVATGSIAVNDYPVCFGENPETTGRHFDGNIDEVRIWNTALDSITIREHMHLSLAGDESGLTGYWQFNENTGAELHDFLNNNHGSLVNMTSPGCWVQSAIPLGGGISDTRTEEPGTVEYTGTGITMTYIAQNGASVTVSRIDTLPNVLSCTGADTLLSGRYWAVNRYGTGAFDADMKFYLSDDLVQNDEQNPGNVKLFTRPSNSDEAWSLVKSAGEVNAEEDYAVFNNITVSGQFIIGRDNYPDISFTPPSLDFSFVPAGDSSSLLLNINNIGTDTLFVTGMVINHPVFSASPVTGSILPYCSLVVDVKFKPLEEIFYNDTLWVHSNDADEPVAFVELGGYSVRPSVSLLELPLGYSFVEGNFNSIDIGSNAYPCFTDLDHDGLVDLIIGSNNQGISHYEQQSESSFIFDLVSQNVSGVNAGFNSTPTITDIDNDGLLDLVFGQTGGNLKHYEQQSENSLVFTLMNEYFNGINAGLFSTPVFTDIEGDGLLDLMVGNNDGTIHHYKQQQANSNTFTLITNNFNSIDVGVRSAPSFTDFDADGLPDMIIGETDGNLNHYEQQAPSSVLFNLITEYFNSIDVGLVSNPTFTDLNGDYLPDLFIGESDGTINRFEQTKVDEIAFGNVKIGQAVTHTYFLRADNIPGNMELQSGHNDFTVSLDENAGFMQNIVINTTENCIYDTVFIRFQPGSEMTYYDTLFHIAEGCDTTCLVLTGNGYFRAANYPGDALAFDGFSEYVDCPGDIQVTGNAPRTIAVWAHAESFNQGGIFQAGPTGSANQDFSLRTTTTDELWRMQFWGTDLDVTLPGSKNAWHHYCLAYDGDTARLYYDGKCAAYLPVNLNTGQSDIWFGRWQSYFFKGKIDEVSLWNYALDSIEIRENIHLNLAVNEPGLLGYWQFNEGSGNTLYNLAGGANGALINMENSDWVVSTIPFGGGTASSQTETGGLVDFTGTGLTMNFVSHTGAAITVARIDTLPNMNPVGTDSVFEAQYWVVNRYGTGNYNANMTFTVAEDLTTGDQNTPSIISLYRRGNTADTNWAFLASAGSVNAATNQATFNGVTVSGQFILAREAEPAGIRLDLIVMLEGPFNGSEMNATLNSGGYLPLSQPYNSAPWNYAGTEAVATIPNADVVDWILVELRDAPDAASAGSAAIVARQAAFLLKDGSVVSVNGSSLPIFFYSPVHSLFTVIWHRNSIGVMSANALTEAGGVYTWDFTTAAGQAYGGGNAHKELAPGIWGLAGADGNADGQVNNGDKIDVWSMQAGTGGYKSGDFNLDAQVNNGDKNDVWVPNTGLGGQVPDYVPQGGTPSDKPDSGYKCQVPD